MNIRCSRCGRVLKDPVSQAMRMGPECRGGSRPATRRQVRVTNRVLRGVAYAEKAPVKIGDSLVYMYDPRDLSWKSDRTTHTHEAFGKFLRYHGMIIEPADHLQDLKLQRQSAAEILKISGALIERDQAQLIKCEMARLKNEISKFSMIVKGGKSDKPRSTKG